MSEGTVARWNAIPMSRDGHQALKRQREDDGNDDDDISLVSRSPSPEPDSMDVDSHDHHKYDEFLHKPVSEVITVNTKIKPTNRGFAMLAKMGWVDGQPIGLSGDGRTEPIPFEIKRDLTGLGKTSQDVRMIEETVSQRRGLDSERQTKETEEQRKAREDGVARKAAVQDEITTTLRAFHCQLCDKQFKNVAQYDEHTNSYAHHHKARFRDMQANIRIKPQEEIDKRKEKEHKREQRELRKIAAAAGIKVAKPVAITHPPPHVTNPPTMDIGMHPTQKKGGWATVGDVGPSGSSAPVSKSGWATVGSASATASVPPPLPTSNLPATLPISPVPHPNPSAPAPVFRTGGWASLDTTAQPQSPPVLPTGNCTDLGPTIPLFASQGNGWSLLPTAVSFNPTPSSTGFQPVTQVPKPIPPAPAAQPVRSGWQQFQAKNSKRK